jgi:hypothetical protein
MTITSLLVVCTIIILLAIWLGLAFVKSAILDKQEMETTILGNGIEEKLNALENIHEERFSKLQDRLTKIEDKIDSLERVMENK